MAFDAACAHHTQATLACPACGKHRRGCSACGLCLDCLAVAITAHEKDHPPVKEPAPAGGMGGLA